MKIIQKFLKNSLRNFNYIIYSEKTKKAIFVDPLDLDQTLPICEELGLKPKYLLLTHNHPDHIAHVDRFLALPGTEKITIGDRESFELSEDEMLHGTHTPGHVDDHYCYLLEDKRGPFGVISGDTVFNAGVGNCKLGGNVEVLANTIRDKFSVLPGSIELYPSHDYLLTNLEFALSVEGSNETIEAMIEERKQMDMDNEFIPTTIGMEKLINPFFRCFYGDFAHLFPELTSKEIFIELRRCRDNW